MSSVFVSKLADNKRSSNRQTRNDLINSNVGKKSRHNDIIYLGRGGGGQVVSVLTFFSVQIPLMPTIFSVKIVFERNENKQKEDGIGPFFDKKRHILVLSKVAETSQH